MKKIFLRVFVVLVVAVAGLAAYVVHLFSAGVPPVDGTLLPGGVVQIVDGQTTAFAIPVGADHVALIDCGLDPDAKAIKKWLADNRKIVDAIFLTHSHSDHRGGCQALGAPISTFAEEEPFLEGREKFTGLLASMGGASPTGLHASRRLRDREDVKVGDRVIRAFLIPGHTAGSAAYLTGGVLIMGDAAVAHKDGTLHPNPWFFNDDLDRDITSVKLLAEAISAETVQVIAFSHTAPLPVEPGGAAAKLRAISP